MLDCLDCLQLIKIKRWLLYLEEMYNSHLGWNNSAAGLNFAEIKGRGKKNERNKFSL